MITSFRIGDQAITQQQETHSSYCRGQRSIE